MPERSFMEPSLLAGWDNFFVIAGSSAAALTGLTFIVITLAGQDHRVSANGLGAFVTPTIVHFSMVLVVSAYLSMPHQTALTLDIGTFAAGILGLIYITVIIVRFRRMVPNYVPVIEDWVWNVVLPFIAYGTALTVAIIGWTGRHTSVHALAACLVLLMLIGIHNAWDIAVWNTIRLPLDKANAPEK